MVLTKIAALMGAVSIGILGIPTESDPSDTTTHIAVHKLKFNESVTPDIPADLTEANTDRYMKWDSSQWGDVGFTIYHINPGAMGDLSVSEMIDLMVSAEANDRPIEGIDGVSKASGEVLVDKDGVALFEISMAEPGYYVAVETTQPETVRNGIGFVYFDSEAAGYGDVIHLYPKSDAEGPSVTLRKVGKSYGEEPVELGGAVFSLYRGEAGQGEAVIDRDGKPARLVTDDNGIIVVSDLLVGDYYLVEEPVANLVDSIELPESNGGSYLLPRWAMNTQENLLTFSYNSDGTLVVDNPDVMSNVLNEGMPNLDKDQVGDGVYNIDEKVEFTLDVNVPDSIDEYTKFVITDELSDGVSFIGDIKISNDKGEVFDNGADYTLSIDGNTMTVDLLVGGVASDKLINADSLMFHYEAKLSDMSFVDNDHVNEAALIFANAPSENIRKISDEETFEYVYHDADKDKPLENTGVDIIKVAGVALGLSVVGGVVYLTLRRKNS